MADNDYELGRIEARLDTSDERHEANIERLDSIEATLKELVESIALVKGGARMLITLGGFSAAIGALSHTFFTWVGEHLK